MTPLRKHFDKVLFYQNILKSMNNNVELINCLFYSHTHGNTTDFEIGKTQLLTNQLGYVKYGEELGFSTDRNIFYNIVLYINTIALYLHNIITNAIMHK
jgi:hypothetical protein